MAHPELKLRLGCCGRTGDLNDRPEIVRELNWDLTAWPEQRVVLKDDKSKVEPLRELASGPRVKSTAANLPPRRSPRQCQVPSRRGQCSNSCAGGCLLRAVPTFFLPTTAVETLPSESMVYLPTGSALRWLAFKLTVHRSAYSVSMAQPEVALPFHLARALRFQQLARR